MKHLDSYRKGLKDIYEVLLKTFGPQHWWPANTRFEVIVGAILTQNTNWSNVKKALDNLKAKNCLNPKELKAISSYKLASLIKPAGYFNVKAKRLKNFMNFFYKEYNSKLFLMKKEPLDILREKLLSVNGIGPETADSILLYAFDKPIFVIDAYTKRVFSRHGFCSSNEDYHKVQAIFMNLFKKDVKMFNEYHALIVKLCKEFCKAKPLCEVCPLQFML